MSAWEVVAEGAGENRLFLGMRGRSPRVASIALKASWDELTIIRDELGGAINFMNISQTWEWCPSDSDLVDAWRNVMPLLLKMRHTRKWWFGMVTLLQAIEEKDQIVGPEAAKIRSEQYSLYYGINK